MIRKNATAFCQCCLSVWVFLFCGFFFSVVFFFFSPRGEDGLHDHEDVLTDGHFTAKQGLQTRINTTS